MNSTRERIGIAIEAQNTLEALIQVKEMEEAGVTQAWSTIGGAGRADTMSFYPVAAKETKKIRLGTSIVPIYPRHPLVLASEVLAITDLAGINRFRLGVGPSHRHIIEDSFGIKMHKPLSYLKEYVEVLRDALSRGEVNHHGEFFNIQAQNLRKAEIPILVSALGEGAFRLGGEISDGVISWLCPVPYLLKFGKPQIKDGAKNRTKEPPLVAHVLVSMSEKESEAISQTQKRLANYTRSPFYTKMFAKAGFVIEREGTEGLARELLVMGNDSEIKEKVLKLLESGLDELLLHLIPVSDDKAERRKLFEMVGSL